MQDVNKTGMEQLNRVMNHGVRLREDLARASAHLETHWDPHERMVEAVGQTLMLRQCNEIIVEASMRSADRKATSSPMSGRTWSELLAAANAYRTLTTISERLHHRVAPPTIEITSAYEIHFNDDAQPEPDTWVLDANALEMASARMHLSRENSFESPREDYQTALNQAMIDAEGASPEDIYIVLLSLIQWGSFTSGSSVATATKSETLAWIYESIGESSELDRTRYEQALTMLTTTSSQLQASTWEPWQTRTRRHRLLVQPIVQCEDETLLIAPQYLLTSLNVYNNHLSQGVLPWTEGIAPKVKDALAQIRDERNREFEKTLASKLRELGFKTIERIKRGDHGRLGVPAVTTEIDLVAGKPGEHTIWLIEAKDPATVHAYAETARQLRMFFRDSTTKGKIKPCYATQLARKEAELEPYVSEVASKLGLQELVDGSSYTLSTLFVTRALMPAGYVGERFPVRTMADFLFQRE